MPVVSLYRANRLWHKGEIAEKEKRKKEKRSILRPITGLGLREEKVSEQSQTISYKVNRETYILHTPPF